MPLLDLVVIYVACGAPFAVYRAFEGTRESRAWLGVLITLGVWPIDAMRSIARTVNARSTDGAAGTDTLRREIEALMFENGDRSRVFEFREVFERYTGLAAAMKLDAVPAATAVLEIAGHPSQTLANACLTRTQRRRLERRLFDARTEFADLVVAADASHLSPIVERLAILTDDHDLMTAISAAMLSSPSPGEARVSVV